MREFACDNTVLVVDIGNTNIVCGIYEQGNLTWFARFQSSRNRTADEYYSLLSPLLNGCALSSIRYIALGSVVPELTRIWLHLFQKYTSATVFETNGKSDLGLSFRIPDPGFIGADLIANAFAAWKKYAKNAIVIDLGTATTIQLVTSEGHFMGAS
ncbi:MAG: type III pantothenate kinase, partial [Candidatus Cloacimonadaceae bacterium]|nr:type III pantothenate kinase [Candidatus Cloacimonadaceae bacterium]